MDQVLILQMTVDALQIPGLVWVCPGCPGHGLTRRVDRVLPVFYTCRTSKNQRGVRWRLFIIYYLWFCLVLWSRHLVLWSLGTYGLRESE
jgi:hypothetical protein